MNDLTNCEIEPLRQDGEFAVARVAGPNGLPSRLMVSPVREQPAPSSVAKLENAFALRDELDTAWAARPVELVKFGGRTALVIDDPSGQFLDELIVEPLAIPDFLHVAIGIVGALGSLHARGLVHKDVKPANFLVKVQTGQAWLTGFGLTSRLPRQRQSPEPPEVIAGTLAYMAPEQTGRMNRSIDSRSDLYSLGVTFYEMCVGGLPFTASDPMELVHCHVARLPVAPNLQRSEIPEPLSAIILKLLAKAAEERYQTAAGVEADLRRCRAALEASGRIESFSLGAGDVPDRLLVPEKLYGREKEIELLLAAFDRVVCQGTTELVLVSGYSGVGKSSVVNELHKVLVPPRGLFASGKFDQYKRDIPYATLAQAFGNLVQQILGKSDAEVARWRDSLGDALGPNGQLIVNLIPEIEFIIGKPPPVPDLPPQEAKHRFQRLLRRFIGVFARPEHPLALFLDDLQWLDTATLDLIEHIIAHPELRHVLLVGAYRDNEVDPGHPLLRTLQEIRARGARIENIVLSPLRPDDLAALVADTLHCHPDHSVLLARLVHEKTGGNPFFATQFITALADENLVAFDPAAAAWTWDLPRILAKGYTDNVVELMVAKLNRLPEATQNSLKHLACVGNSAAAATLHLLYDETGEGLHSALWEPLRLGLVARSDDIYSFVHDRVQEAAYALVPVDERAEAHLRIGRILASQVTPANLEENIFEIVNHLNRGMVLIRSSAEREKLTEFNLVAGKRAQASSAYESALNYLTTGASLLADDCWERRHDLLFALELARAQCESASGAVAEAEQRLSNLSSNAATTEERAFVACLRVDLYQGIDRSDQAVSVGLDVLRHLGIDLPARPTEAEARREYEGIWSRLADRPIEDLIDLPLMRDRASLATLDLLIRVAVPGFFASSHLFAVAVCRAVNLGLEQGHSDASCLAYEFLAMLAGPHFGNYDAGYRFGRLGCDLVERPGLKQFQARTYQIFGFIAPWTRHVRTGRDHLIRAFDVASRLGDITYTGYASAQINTNLLMAGDPLIKAQREADRGLAIARKMQFGLIVGWISGQLGLIRMLRGLTIRFGSFDNAEFNEAEFESYLASNPALALPECWYWIRKLQARFLAGDYFGALDASSRARPMLWASLSLLEMVEFHFYDALSHAAVHDLTSSEDREYHCARLAEHLEKLATWELHGPENFANRAALVRAEVARIEGRDADAIGMYDRAIRSARKHGFVQNEGVAYEVAARFYAARGAETVAEAFLRNARHCYLRWGADGKVQQLDRLYPQLAVPEGPLPAALNATIGTSVGQLDTETVARASQALSSEIVLPKLIEKLMRIAVAHAGAERGLLILLRRSKPLIEAEATTGHGRVEVQVQQMEITSSDLPLSALHYVIRTRERVLIDDSSVRNLYSDDEYVAQKKARSVLCLPIVKQTQLIGVLYLENDLTPYVFTSGRLAVLDMLASQAAISLENARLYAELEQENLDRKRAEEGLRRGEAYLAEAQKLSCTGSFGWSVATDEHFWSDETYRIFEYEVSRKITMQMVRERIHPEDISLLDELIARASDGDGFDYEYRLLLPTGAIKQVHVVAHALRGEFGAHEFVGAVMDITATRRAEAALRQAQAELAHATRVTMMGELAASIAHEINQPIAGVVINGNACLRWLARVNSKSVELEEVRETLQRIIRDGNRAGEIISRIRALFKKTELPREPLDLNEAIREIIVLARSEMDNQRVMLRLELPPGLPRVVGDRVQLQQVMLNLILNAIDAMATVHDRPRDLVIRTQAGEDGTVLSTFRDTGIGLSPESIDHVFKAFHTTKPGGLGMGLSISRSIVESHCGRLWATANDGPGAIFQFTLPHVNPELDGTSEHERSDKL